MQGRFLKAWLAILALWTGGGYVLFVIDSAHGGAGLAWGVLAGGAVVALFWLAVFVMLRIARRRQHRG